MFIEKLSIFNISFFICKNLDICYQIKTIRKKHTEVVDKN